MARPKLENGYVRLSNELLSAIVVAKLSGTEYQILFGVIRKTYGWNKKSDWISYSQLEEITGRTRRAIAKSLSKLVNKSILVKEPNSGKKNLLKLNKNWEEWKELGNKNALVNKKVLTRELLVSQLGNKRTTTINTNTKYTKQKGNQDFGEADPLARYPLNGDGNAGV